MLTLHEWEVMIISLLRNVLLYPFNVFAYMRKNWISNLILQSTKLFKKVNNVFTDLDYLPKTVASVSVIFVYGLEDWDFLSWRLVRTVSRISILSNE